MARLLLPNGPNLNLLHDGANLVSDGESAVRSAAAYLATE
jgi:hypothetical protein